MADLVSGRYPQANPLWSLFGLQTNVLDNEAPVFSNAEWLGINGLADTSASLVTQLMTVVPVPVDAGNSISKISVLVGATAGATMTHQWAALYAGTNTATPALIGQTPDGTSGAIAASARFDFSFATPQLITPALAPYGYVFAAIMVAASTVPSLATVPNGAAAVQYAWWSNTPGASFATVPGALAFSAGSSLGATAPTTLTSVAAKTVAPLVFLS